MTQGKIQTGTPEPTKQPADKKPDGGGDEIGQKADEALHDAEQAVEDAGR